MITKHLDYKGPVPLNVWRKVAIATWKTTKDPSIYGFVDLDAGPLLAKIEEARSRGIRLTPTILVAKGIAHGIARYPAFNSILRLGKLYERKTIDVFLQVSAVENGEENLSGTVIREVNHKSLEQILEELHQKAKRIRSNEDPEFKSIKSRLRHVPSWIIARVLDTVSFLTHTLNLWSPLLGTPRDPFGSAMVTSVGGMGLEYGFAPLVPYSRCPMVLAIGKISDRPVVENGQIVIKPMLPVSVTLDHRLIDGYGCSRILEGLKEYLKHPH
jgi:pyruvate/2-oxoglutarate dehydrogenase complex dihydrolipoamide acyltransferase (E2) component